MREPLFLRLYRRTLAPASDEFRGRYAREMEQSLVSMMAAERARRGRLAAAWLWLRAVADARRIAWRERPPGRSVRARRVLAGLGDDVSYVWRSWRRAPGFAATAVLTLSLGIALNASIFSLADGLLFRPLPFPDPDDLFQVRSAGARRGFPWAIDMREARARHPDLLGVVDWGVADRVGGNLRVDGRWISPLTYEVSPGFAEMLGVWPQLGRPFAAGDHVTNAPLVAVISDRYWRREFGADPATIGRRLVMPQADGDRVIEIVGILPTWFRSLDIVNDAPDMLVPQVDTAWNETMVNRRPNLVDVTIRIRPGRSAADVEARLNAIVAGVAATQPETEPGRTVRLVPLRDQLFGRVAPTARLVMIGAVAVLLLVMTNLTHMLLARVTARARETGLRAALGASRWRLVRLVGTECLLLAIAGGGAGFLAGAGLSRVFESQLPEMAHAYRAAAILYGVRVAVVAAGLAMIVSLVAGVIPAVRFSRLSAGQAFQARAQSFQAGRWRIGRLLLATQVALAFVVVISGALVAVSLYRMLTQPMGFDARHAYTLSVSSYAPRPITVVEQRERAQWLMHELRTVPGVRAVGVIDGHPIVTLEGTAERDGKALQAVRAKFVAGAFFDAMGMPVLDGRTFTEPEGFADASVAVVDEGAAAELWPGRNPIGQTVNVTGGLHATVVGVVGRLRLALDAENDWRSTVYLPLRQSARRHLSLVVRTDTSPAAIEAAANRLVRSRDPDARIGAWPLHPAAVFSREVGEPILRSSVMGAFSVIALALIGVGLYGLVGYVVEHCVREFGVRLALGATPRDIHGLVIRQALMPVAIGLAAGVAGALWATQFLRTWLFAVAPTDPAMFAAVAALMLGCAVAAALRPAARAMRVDPVMTLKAE